MNIFYKKNLLSSLFLSMALGLSGCGQNALDAECGNGTLEAGEQCDDGDTISGDGCSANCEEEVDEDECGDGDLGDNEECDDGNTLNGDGCSSDCEEESPSEAQLIDGYVRSLGALPPVSEERTEGSPSPFDSNNDNYSCTSQNVTETKALTEVSILADGTSFIFPGAILRGDSLQGGGFTETAFDRKPMTYSLSLLDGTSGARSATMANPSLSQFRDSIGAVLEQANLGNVPIASNVNIQEVKSQTELDFALGVGVNSPSFDIKGKFDFANEEIRSHYLVTIDTRFFTADVDAIVNPSDLFANNVSLQEMQQKFSDGNPPVYISSITYGSRIYLAFESQFDSQEIGAALEASFKNGPVTADGSVSLSSKEVLQSSSFDLVTIGASAEQIANLTGALSSPDPIAAVKTFLASPNFFSAETIGSPISFQMKLLADNQPAAFGFSGTFDVVSCLRISQNIQIQLDTIKAENIDDNGAFDSDAALELFGTINALGTDSLADSGLIFNATSANPRSVGNAGVSFGGIQNRTTLQIDPEEQGDIRIVVNLGDVDNNSADNIINFASTLFPFNEGFNLSEQNLVFSTSQGLVTVTLSMKPVF